jgi:hypothetical protein
LNKLFYFDEKYFYKSYNTLSKEDRINLIEESELYLKTHRKIEELHPPIMAEKFFTKKLLEKECWKNLTKKVVDEINEYSKTYLNVVPKFESCWINKVGSYDDTDIKNTLYFDEDVQSYTDNHYHSHHEGQIISCIFYLQNPNKKYGTLVRTKNGSLVLDGTENSLTIFDPRLHHTALTPNSEVSSVYPRYVIIMSFIKKEGCITPLT